MLASWPELAELILSTMMARRQWHEANGHGVARLIAAAWLAARLRGPRPARAQPHPRALVRRRHRRRERGDARLAEDPARGDAGPRAQPVGAAQSVGRPGRPRARPARGDRRRALRPRRARRWARGARGRRVRRLGGAADARDRGVGARRPGRHEHADRELPRLPDRDHGHRADAQGDAAGAPLRRGAVELSPRGRARARRRGAHPRRPRRRAARARPHGRRRHGRALARARGGERRAVHRRRRLPRRHGDRRGTLPRRGRHRGRGRQLGRPGGGAPVAHGAQRPHRHPGRRPGRDDVALPGRAHRGAPEHRDHHPDRGQRLPRRRPARARGSAQPRGREHRARRGFGRVRDDRRRPVHRGGAA